LKPRRGIKRVNVNIEKEKRLCILKLRLSNALGEKAIREFVPFRVHDNGAGYLRVSAAFGSARKALFDFHKNGILLKGFSGRIVTDFRNSENTLKLFCHFFTKHGGGSLSL
jgi:hypothetical protein